MNVSFSPTVAWISALPRAYPIFAITSYMQPMLSVITMTCNKYVLDLALDLEPPTSWSSVPASMHSTCRRSSPLPGSRTCYIFLITITTYFVSFRPSSLQSDMTMDTRQLHIGHLHRHLLVDIIQAREGLVRLGSVGRSDRSPHQRKQVSCFTDDYFVFLFWKCAGPPTPYRQQLLTSFSIGWQNYTIPAVLVIGQLGVAKCDVTTWQVTVGMRDYGSCAQIKTLLWNIDLIKTQAYYIRVIMYIRGIMTLHTNIGECIVVVPL